MLCSIICKVLDVDEGEDERLVHVPYLTTQTPLPPTNSEVIADSVCVCSIITILWLHVQTTLSELHVRWPPWLAKVLDMESDRGGPPFTLICMRYSYMYMSVDFVTWMLCLILRRQIKVLASASVYLRYIRCCEKKVKSWQWPKINPRAPDCQLTYLSFSCNIKPVFFSPEVF